MTTGSKVAITVGILIALGAAGVFATSTLSGPEIGGDIPVVDNLQVENPIPTVQPVENSVSILTPQEKAARDEAARLAAEEAARQASSTATSTATSSEAIETAEE